MPTTWIEDAAVELLLLSTLGLKGIFVLQRALCVTPSNTPDRNGFLLSMMQQSGFSLDEKHCRICISLLERLNIRHLYSPEPLSASAEEDGRSAGPSRSADAGMHANNVQLILSPPNDVCINMGCSIKGKEGSLMKNHEPTVVTVFTLGGPVVAHKFTLRCARCSTIYNYSMFGKKRTDGECYYSHRRNLIEISDSVYCERELYNLFCSLR